MAALGLGETADTVVPVAEISNCRLRAGRVAVGLVGALELAMTAVG